MNSKQWGKAIITSNNESVQLYFDSTMNHTHYESTSMAWACNWYIALTTVHIITDI